MCGTGIWGVAILEHEDSTHELCSCDRWQEITEASDNDSGSIVRAKVHKWQTPGYGLKPD